MRIRIVCFELLQLASFELGGSRVLELVKTLSDCLFADMHSAGDLRRRPPEAMDLCCDEDCRPTESVWSAAFRHPAAVHRLNQSNRRVFDILELVLKLQLQAEFLDVK